jgi:hypothetical protein
MEHFSIIQVREKKIRDFFLMHKSGYPLYHHGYLSTKVDPSLVSGFLTSIFNFSQQMTSETIKKMHMDGYISIYEPNDMLIYILNIYNDSDTTLAQNILQQIIKKVQELSLQIEPSIRNDGNIMANMLDSVKFGDKINEIISSEILKDYFKSPSGILKEIETFLSDLFGSMGKQVIDSAVIKACGSPLKFKVEHLPNVIKIMKESLSKKMSADQIDSLMAQLEQTFLGKV